LPLVLRAALAVELLGFRRRESAVEDETPEIVAVRLVRGEQLRRVGLVLRRRHGLS